MKKRMAILAALAFVAVSLSIGSWLYKDKYREFYAYPSSYLKFACDTITIDGKSLLHGPCTAWWRNTKVGKGQFYRGERIGHWQFEMGGPQSRITGEFRRRGVRVENRYFGIISITDPQAVTWCPDNWKPLPYADRMIVLREQVAMFEQQLSNLVKNDPQLANVAVRLKGKTSDFRYDLDYVTNCDGGYEIKPPNNPKTPYMGIFFRVWLVDPLAPGDRQQPAVEGSIDPGPRGYRLGMVEDTFGFMITIGTSNPLLDQQIYDLCNAMIKNLRDWAQEHRQRMNMTSGRSG